jgi:putative membrane protein
MLTPIRSIVSVLAAGLAMAACSSSNDRPYAHESMRHVTAAERLFGTQGEPAATPVASVTTVTEPTLVTPSAPLTVPQTVARMAPSDAVFAQQLLSSSALEIELARIAFVRAQSPDVRSFARQMLIDHREMAAKLDNFGLVRGYLISWQIEPEGANTIARFRSLDTASFDRAYMDEMVAAHEKAVATPEAQAASDRETASIATDYLPIVRHHLEMARALRAQL